jgi:hypothetical protein
MLDLETLHQQQHYDREIPTSIGEMTNAVVLDFQRNRSPAPCPSPVASLQNLNSSLTRTI